MKSPVDPNAKLLREQLEGGPTAMVCPATGGAWIRPGLYWRWLEQQGDAAPEAAHDDDPGVDLPTQDSPAGKRCPEDGHFLIRHQVGHGLHFHVDRCGHCGGVWLDAGEWQALRAGGLDRKLHLVFTSTWQARVFDQQRREARQRLLADQIGEVDYAELKRITAWIASRPTRHQMQAYLIDELRDRA